jgi:hypothetical protein
VKKIATSASVAADAVAILNTLYASNNPPFAAIIATFVDMNKSSSKFV